MRDYLAIRLTTCGLRGASGLDAQLTQHYLQSDEGRQEVVASDVYARRLGINGVPCFIIDGKYALSGAQDPEFFLPLFDLGRQEQTSSAAAE